MPPLLTAGVLAAYFGMLCLVAWWRGRGADGDSFYLGGRKNSWLLISYGMVGVAISGITYVSVPGQVAERQFTYFQLVIGYVLGLLVVALVLLPVFYRENNVSIYAFLEDRFGPRTHRTGVLFFLAAHLTGAAFRLYLMAFVLQYILFDQLGVPFAVTVAVTLGLIWLYTFQGGIRTIIITDCLQTTFLLAGVALTVVAVGSSLNLGLGELAGRMETEGLTRVFQWEWASPRNFWKLVLTGMLLTIMTNGLDQAIMQKHLSCANLGAAQKNIFLLCAVLLAVNLMFLFMGGSLVVFAWETGLEMPARADQLFPMIAAHHLGPVAGVAFVVGIAAAAYSSADSSLTGLTTAFCIDFLRFKQGRENDPRVRTWVHLMFTGLLFLLIVGFRAIHDESVINAFIRVSGYVYGPLFGLFAFGLWTRRKVRDGWTPALCVGAPLAALVLDQNAAQWFGGFQFGDGIMVVNSLLTLGGLFLLPTEKSKQGAKT